MIRKLTTFIGFIVILAAPASVFIKDVTWWDALAGIFAGILLVFVKEPRIDQLIETYIKTKRK